MLDALGNDKWRLIASGNEKVVQESQCLADKGVAAILGGGFARSSMAKVLQACQNALDLNLYDFRSRVKILSRHSCAC